MLNPNKSAIIIVGGRGCYADATQYNLYAKVLRSYGIAVLAYQKRGNGSSTGNCNLATIEDLANDVVAAKIYLENHKSNFKNIGVLGISAGSWVMAKAEEKTNFDFMISIVGPSTSVKDQQLQSASYGAEFYNLNSSVKSNLLTYTNLLFDAKPSQKSFNEMQNLLEISKKEGWDKLLETTDIAKTQDDIKNLWVRRHNYNPKKVLENFNKPFLGIYGDRDWIVPQQENIKLLKTYFKNNIDNLTTINAYNAEHGMEMEAKYISLENDKSYWHFYRISPEVRISIADFLAKHKFIK